MLIGVLIADFHAMLRVSSASMSGPIVSWSLICTQCAAARFTTPLSLSLSARTYGDEIPARPELDQASRLKCRISSSGSFSERSTSALIAAWLFSRPAVSIHSRLRSGLFSRRSTATTASAAAGSLSRFNFRKSLRILPSPREPTAKLLDPLVPSACVAATFLTLQNLNLLRRDVLPLVHHHPARGHHVIAVHPLTIFLMKAERRASVA